MTLPTWRDWLFSAKAFLASMLALYIALAFDLPRPYWAMAAVYVVANPLVGATSSKGLYRALGTLIGASAAVILVPLFVNAPELLCLVVALWTGTLLYISMLDRTPRSYVFMLAGYSLPLIAFPEVSTPELVFDVAIARSEEIIIGITCATIVGAVIFPTNLASTLSSRINGWLDDASAWMGEILRGEGAVPETPAARQKLAADIAGLDAIISQLAYDPATRDVAPQARELRGKLLMLLPLLSSLADRLHALQDRDGALPAEFAALLKRVADWISARTADRAAVDALLARVEALRTGESARDWDALMLSGALDRLSEIVELWADCLRLKADIESGRRTPLMRNSREKRAVALARFHDFGLMAFSAGSVVAATLLASAFWIFSGWSSGGTMVMMAAVACSFFATMDRPAPMIRTMAVWCGVSLVVAGLYQFALLPLVHDFEMLVLLFAPAFLMLGLLIPRPQYMMIGMLVAVNTASFVAMQNRITVDFLSFANEGLAAMTGLVFAFVWTIVTRPFGAEIAARRLVRAGWTDLAELASGRTFGDHERLAGRMLDRLSQLVPRLAAIDERELGKVDGYVEVRVGFNIVELQKARRSIGEAGRSAIDAILSDLAGLYRERSSQGRFVPATDALRDAFDTSLRTVARDSSAASPQALNALAGLRRLLFPQAPGPSGTLLPGSGGQHFLIAAE